MGVYTHQLYDNTLYINKIQKTLLSEPPSWGSHPTQTKKGSITASFSAESEVSSENATEWFLWAIFGIKVTSDLHSV